MSVWNNEIQKVITNYILYIQKPFFKEEEQSDHQMRWKRIIQRYSCMVSHMKNLTWQKITGYEYYIIKLVGYAELNVALFD